MSDNKELHDFRCVKCGKLLGKNHLDHGVMEVKCVRCGALNVLFRDNKEQIIITDPEGKIMFANSLTEIVTGYQLEEIIGKTPAIWGGQMSKEFYAHMWKKIRDEKKTISVEVLNKRKDGEKYYANLIISPVLDSHGEIKFYVGVESIIKDKKYEDSTNA